MDLSQIKLSKAEWESIESPIEENEKIILKLIIDGSSNVNIKMNPYLSLLSFMKLSFDTKMENHIYKVYFSELFSGLSAKYKIDFPKTEHSTLTLKKADVIRFKSIDANQINEHKNKIYDFVLYDHLEKLFKYKDSSEKKWKFHYFTLYHLSKRNILHVNKLLIDNIQFILEKFHSDIEISYFIYNSYHFIEKNKDLLKYKDLELYSHQKDIFSLFQSQSDIEKRSNLVLYTAPTGTGKTLTPVGLSNHKKIIFVCAARHVGLALAKSAISVNKKIAFAFGCTDASDIRLHYFAAKDYSVNYKTGGIFKVDNSVGDKVEIMICDVKSYLPAMHYMLAFNEPQSLITYWDEPTISMDYQTHELHDILGKNWKENLIPNVVLSSATLPKQHEIFNTISFFKNKFPNAEITNIESFDCSKSISLIDTDGFIVMPHYITPEYQEAKDIIKHLFQNKTILRYLDLQECVQFIEHVETNNFIKRSAFIERNFTSLEDVTMSNIKIHYLTTLDSILAGVWGAVFIHFKMSKPRRIQYNEQVDEKGIPIPKVKANAKANAKSASNKENSNSPLNQSSVYITTKDAHTLTDGPTIYLTNGINKIAGFCITQAAIPSSMLKELTDKIRFNDKIQEKMSMLEKQIEEEVDKKTSEDEDNTNKKSNKSEEKIYKSKKIIELQVAICNLRNEVKYASLDDVYIPNSKKHLSKWIPESIVENSFTSMIDVSIVQDIMVLPIENVWKILLIMGIGVFASHENIAYREMMKKLADEQKLYLIIADSDYIYGTNYQFCHGILGKDLVLSQEKLIQALGRIGRNSIQQNYTIRFRNSDHAHLLFKIIPPNEKIEVINMNKLFST